MKKLALFTSILLILSCGTKNSTEYSITASAVGFEDGTMVYVNAISQSNRPTIIDSSAIKNGKFSFNLPPVEYRDFNYLTFNNQVNGNVLFLAENNPIEMTIYKDSLKASVIKGGTENELFFKYLAVVNDINDRKVALNSQFQYASKLREISNLKRISKEQEDLKKEEVDVRLEFAKTNTNSLVAVMALADLSRLKGGVKAKEMSTLFNAIEDTLKTTRLGKNLQSLVNRALAEASRKKIEVGNIAEDFTAPTPDGKMLSLKDAMGKVTIVDFWASWCKPCRLENPNVVRVYNKYHDKGLNIIGISLDKAKISWTKAIKDDQLNWQHISNLKYWQEPIAKQYGVRSIPATFILDENGTIIAKNLRGPALENKISELLDGTVL